MLPQVANHIIHHTTRAVAAAQNQAGTTLRNVLGIQSSGPPAQPWNNTGSSSWGSGHAGTGGGAKYHTGSRFYTGYTGPGRAITQASATTGNDAGANQADDSDEALVLPKSSKPRTRTRSQSFSLGSGAHGKSQRAQSFGVLKAVQEHARHHHVFQGPRRPLLPFTEDARDVAPAPIPRMTRRNSTASTVSISSAHEQDLKEPSRAPTPVSALDPTDPAAPQTVLEPESKELLTPTRALLEEAHGDEFKTRAAIQRLRDPETKSVVSEWNDAMTVLIRLRKDTEPLTELLGLYNDMVDRRLRPNNRTYALMIGALLRRDIEVVSQVRALNARATRRKILKAPDPAEDFVESQRIAALESENNFGSALALFDAADTVLRWTFHDTVYSDLVRACALHHNVDVALRIFAHIERRDLRASANTYAHLLDVYIRSGDMAGAQVVFDEFKRMAAAGKVFWLWRHHSRLDFAYPWNNMIRAHIQNGHPEVALGLLEEMLDTPNGTEYTHTEVPAPSTATYNTIIEAFCTAGDMESALGWFDRLLATGKEVDGQHTPIVTPPAPTPNMLEHIVLGLIQKGDVDQLNAFFEKTHDKVSWYRAQRIPLFAVNVNRLENENLPSEQAVAVLDHLMAKVVGGREFWTYNFRVLGGPHVQMRRVAALYARYGEFEKAVGIFEEIVNHHIPDDAPRGIARDTDVQIAWVRSIVRDKAGAPRDVPLGVALRMATMYTARRRAAGQDVVEAVNRAYDQVDQASDLGQEEAAALATCVAAGGAQENALERATKLVRDMAKTGVEPQEWDDATKNALQEVVNTIVELQGVEGAHAVLKPLGEAYVALIPVPDTVPTTPELTTESVVSSQDQDFPTTPLPQDTGLRVDAYHSRFVEEALMMYLTSSGLPGTTHEALKRFEAGVQMGVYPTPACIGKIMEMLGRIKDFDRLFEMYGAAQLALGLVEGKGREEEHKEGWWAVENAMIMALGHAGDGPRADWHRARMLEHGMTPSVDAYGALIQCVKDTTDDTAHAMTYFGESQARGVVPNTYLYNTAISKLAKARKADLAVELFERMKADGLRPSSVTYGAVVAACCRVGDGESAEALFEEMAAQTNFKPRIPPYNTMMQFFVQTKPNLDKFLKYYGKMKQAGIRPTAHTYKLLLDAYGTIEPVDFRKMEKSFADLSAERTLNVQGAHWASLINAYGCVGKSLEKATAVFDSIATHPTTLASGLSLPDAVTFESLINVLVTLRRADLIPYYVDRLKGLGIHMTAYIANLLIRGYSAAGEIEQARALFENLVDPPVGVAAPNNHAPHNATPARTVAPDAPVFREPSTWEAMVRAELGQGNRDCAVALLARLKARQYPESIYNRISGIMLDDAVSPWPSEPAASASTPASP
ncbi:hypothetical protein OF83DRAFT_1063300 [Amylostereum chailletii]|nr:hypothetical protein OF83DRAFT_1063300 [Amylostereum chailletii]